MSLCNKGKYYVLLLVALTGCGFHPLYGRQSTDSNSVAANVIFGGVKVDPVPGQRSRLAQQFRSDLEDRLNPDGDVPAKPAYRLSVTLTTSEIPIGTSRDGTVSRYNVYLNSNYAIFRTADNKEISVGSVHHVSSYSNQVNAYFSTYVSEEDALSRGVTELSELYRARLGAYFAQGAPEQDIKKIDPTKPDPTKVDLQNPYLSNPFNSDLPQQTPGALRP